MNKGYRQIRNKVLSLKTKGSIKRYLVIIDHAIMNIDSSIDDFKIGIEHTCADGELEPE